MALFSILVLVLTVAGVSAILRRSIFLPVQRLAMYAVQLAAGRRDIEPPELTEELETIGKSLQELSQGSSEKNSAVPPRS
jgi:HAMP domain-containing protein